MKQSRTFNKNKKPKKRTPNVISVRFLHWDNETKKLSAITYKPYHFKLTRELNQKLIRRNLNKTLVLETKNNGKYSIAVIDKVYYEKNPYIVNKYKELDVGKILISNTRFNRKIIHFPTKRNWRDPSKYEYIEKGLIALVNFCNTIKTNNVTIAVPQLGCGLGGLEWKQVLNLIRKYLGPIQHITFYIYGPRL